MGQSKPGRERGEEPPSRRDGRTKDLLGDKFGVFEE